MHRSKSRFPRRLCFLSCCPRGPKSYACLLWLSRFHLGTSGTCRNTTGTLAARYTDAVLFSSGHEFLFELISGWGTYFYSYIDSNKDLQSFSFGRPSSPAPWPTRSRLTRPPCQDCVALYIICPITFSSPISAQDSKTTLSHLPTFPFLHDTRSHRFLFCFFDLGHNHTILAR